MKKSSIVVMVLAILAIVVVSFDVVYYLSHFTSFENGAEKIGNVKKEEKTDSKAAQKENKEIEKTLERVQTALNQYQTNNRGAVPIIGSTGANSWGYFEENYLNTCYGDDCDEFSKTYSLEVCDYATGECKHPNLLNWDTDKYIVYVTTRAICDDTSGIRSNTGARKVAIYAVKNPDDDTQTEPYFWCLNN